MKTNNYTIQFNKDTSLNMEFLEIWGTLDDGVNFIVRSPIESIQKSIALSNRFYLMVLSIAIPIMIQNGITQFVSLLDNIMVGRIDEAHLRGVSVANTLIFVFNLAIFGAVSGAGIFAAQYHGAATARACSTPSASSCSFARC